ncbi:hypothetical protein SLH49_15785 [Cognatiyoonia sp. IB215446]|uniref:hypothetical protein n=1 Tax=Cognatiyoonia sp. IB215446 TaxID=3097355 RepID=UPI002A1237CD|nr:hypothetical protein [Cognatiyoonia sp. IB215446]MDX8349447.1 hypothetical protein [Cognatiyoonia sp. IB215446]
MSRQPHHCDLPPDFNPETAPPTLTIDWDAYLPFFEDEDISEEEKRELIEALWSIVVSFVDLGFGVHSVQQACGQNEVLVGDASKDLVSLLQDDWNKAQQCEQEDTWQDQ